MKGAPYCLVCVTYEHTQYKGSFGTKVSFSFDLTLYARGCVVFYY